MRTRRRDGADASERNRIVGPWLAAIAVAAVLVAQSYAASLTKSPVFDEPPHIASGLSYLAGHVFYANPQHPPLMKELSAWSLRAAGIDWPRTPVAERLLQGDPRQANMEWTIGNDVIAANPDRVMWWARLPLIAVAGVLPLAIFWWGRQLFGTTAGLAAALLCALDPIVIGHSFLVTTDVGVTTFTVLFLALLWRYVQRPSTSWLVACGVALGLALGAKFSAVLLFPIAALLLVAAVRWPSATSGPRTFTAAIGAWLAIAAIAIVVVEALYFFPRNPLLYLEGMGHVNGDHIAGQQSFFNGELADRFYTYFVAAYLLKAPIASILLAAGGLFVLRQRQLPLASAFLLLPPLAFVAAATFKADDLGVRYVMPALPIAHLLGGLALATLIAGGAAWKRPVAALAVAWLAVAAAGIYPDHLSYFNEAACLPDHADQIGLDGGTRCGPLWLDDSNVDWGQGLKQLRAWMQAHGGGRPLHLAYFGTFPPERYGLAYEKVEAAQLISRPAPGLYAISAFWIGRLPAGVAALATGGSSWLSEATPVAIVGHAIYIYDVR